MPNVGRGLNGQTWDKDGWEIVKTVPLKLQGVREEYPRSGGWWVLFSRKKYRKHPGPEMVCIAATVGHT